MEYKILTMKLVILMGNVNVRQDIQEKSVLIALILTIAQDLYVQNANVMTLVVGIKHVVVLGNVIAMKNMLDQSVASVLNGITRLQLVYVINADATKIQQRVATRGVDVFVRHILKGLNVIW